MTQTPITTPDTIPDRLSIDKKSPHFHPDFRLSIDKKSPHFHPDFRLVGVKLDGETRPNDTFEFCVSCGWLKKILYTNGVNKKPILERGKPRTILIRGKITTFIKPT